MEGSELRICSRVVLLLVFISFSKAQDCHDKFRAISGHSACLSDSPQLRASGVSDAQKQEIVDVHNNFRRNVNPPATNMEKMVWDDEIAMVAQRWASSCSSTAHDENIARSIPGRFVSVGQNWAGGQTTWTDVITDWYNEVNDFTYNQAPPAGKVVGHYTQVVWDVSAKIGCGYAECSNVGFGRIYVCNYGPGGNSANRLYRPYEINGVRCSKCQNTCDNGLCDCGGKTCYNGGTLDVSTCNCTCSQTYHVGAECDLDCNTALDAILCETHPQNQQVGFSFKEAECATFTNVPSVCPNMCKVCPAGGINYQQPTTAAPTTIEVQTTRMMTPADTATPRAPSTVRSTETPTTRATVTVTPATKPAGCNGPLLCQEFLLETQAPDVTYRGRYSFDGFVNNRPYYQLQQPTGNADDIYLYYNHRNETCSYWAVGPLMSNTTTLALNPDPSGNPLNAGATWRYYKDDLLLQDGTMSLSCVSYPS